MAGVGVGPGAGEWGKLEAIIAVEVYVGNGAAAGREVAVGVGISAGDVAVATTAAAGPSASSTEVAVDDDGSWVEPRKAATATSAIKINPTSPRNQAVGSLTNLRI
jgi:hypothetical protein